MAWVLDTLGLVALGITALLLTLRALNRARDERAHYRLSVAFWLLLAAFGVVVATTLGRPLLAQSVMPDLGLVTAGLIAVLPAIVIGAGLRNALALWRAHARRSRALVPGCASITARIVECRRWAFGQDIMALVVEADIPEPQPSRSLSYRRDGTTTVRRRFVETCPGDHWQRLTPGSDVTLRYDPDDLRAYAVLLFSPAA